MLTNQEAALVPSILTFSLQHQALSKSLLEPGEASPHAQGHLASGGVKRVTHNPGLFCNHAHAGKAW